MSITKQNITEKLYVAGLINNTEVKTADALTDLVTGITGKSYTSKATVLTALNNGTLTADTYIYYRITAPSTYIVDTAQRVVDVY